MNRVSLLLLLLVVFLATAACRPIGGSPAPTDLKPVGEGLKVIGFAVVGAAVVLSVGRSFRQP